MKNIILGIIALIGLLITGTIVHATPHNQLYNDPVNTGLHELHVPGFNSGTSTQRLAYPTGSLLVSDQWFESDTLKTYQWDGLEWRQFRILGTDTPVWTVTPTFTPTFTNTLTPTNTPTNSPTCASSWTPGCGNQGTFTPTPTQTCASSWTPGCGNQGTSTFTTTATPTFINTITSTPTNTYTPAVYIFNQSATAVPTQTGS